MKKLLLLLLFIPFAFGFEAGTYTQGQINAFDINSINIDSLGCYADNERSGLYYNEAGQMEFLYVFLCLDIWSSGYNYEVMYNYKYATFPIDDFVTCTESYTLPFCRAYFENELYNQALLMVEETKHKIESYQTVGEHHGIFSYFKDLDMF